MICAICWRDTETLRATVHEACIADLRATAQRLERERAAATYELELARIELDRLRRRLAEHEAKGGRP